jgi:steroid delta-isomerase
MQFPDGLDAHPARDASIRSMRAVEAGDRTGWLSVFAVDATVEDPIGRSPLDPEGTGHRGIDAISAFYDNVIGPNESITFEIRESWAAGAEVANVGTITTTLPDGGGQVHTDGVFTYRVDEAGDVAALRAFWEPERLRFA